MKRIHMVLVVVAVVAVLVIAGATLTTATDSFPKKAVLKAQDMETITHIHANWTQQSLNTFENSSLPYGAKRAAESGVRSENDFSGYAFGFLVAEMSSAEEAEEQYHGFISLEPFQNESFWNQTSLDSIGDEAVMFTSNVSSPLIGCWVAFHKGVYLVTILGVGDATILPSIMLRLAEAQVDRL